MLKPLGWKKAASSEKVDQILTGLRKKQVEDVNLGFSKQFLSGCHDESFACEACGKIYQTCRCSTPKEKIIKGFCHEHVKEDCSMKSLTKSAKNSGKRKKDLQNIIKKRGYNKAKLIR